MIKMIYAYKESSLINDFLFRQIREAKFDGEVLMVGWSIEKNPMLVEHYDIARYHTAIFTDMDGNELLRIEQPFDSSELERAVVHAKQIQLNRENGVLV